MSKNLQQKDYYFICAEWIEVHEPPVIQAADAPPQQAFVSRVRRNMVIDVHPVVHAAFNQEKLRGFTILWAMQCRREHYELIVKLVEEQVKAKAQSESESENEQAAGADA